MWILEIIIVLSLNMFISAVDISGNNREIIKAIKGFGWTQVLIVDKRTNVTFEQRTQMLKAASDQNIISITKLSFQEILKTLKHGNLSLLYISGSQSNYKEFEQLVTTI